MTALREKLIEFISEETSITVSSDVKKLSTAIQERGKVSSILFYGSGLWKEEGADTVYDFYVLVDRFKDLKINKLSAFLGILIPPNVYYMELQDGNRTLRCKYAVMQTSQFFRATKGCAITPQIWARFSQPCRILYSRDSQVEKNINQSLTDAVIYFHRQALPLTLPVDTPRELWLKGLSATYGAELRSEKPERTEILFDASADSFIARSEMVIPLLPDVKRNSNYAALKNRLKRPLQKLYAFIRLMKATLTFEGSVDYALYKIERQSGVRVKASNFQRRYPLIGAWPLVWKVWRKGGFR